MEGRPRREIKLPAKFKEEEETVVGKKRASKDAEEEDPVVYCICRKPYREGDFMIHCDKCKEWFHGNCVRVTQREAAKIKKYVCPTCHEEEIPAVARLVLEEPSKIPKKHRSLETAKGDKVQTAAGDKAAEAKPPKAPAGAKASAKAAEVGKETAAAKPHEKTVNGAESEEGKSAKRKVSEGIVQGAEKAQGEVGGEGQGVKDGNEMKEGREGKEGKAATEGKERKEGAAPVKARPKREDLVCSACKNKGHIRTHRECPLFGQTLPSPSNGKKAGTAVAAEPKPDAPRSDKHKEVVVPSDEDEPILARKKPAPSPKATSTSAPVETFASAAKDAPSATDDDDHAHMLHPVNTSSHFDTGAALLVAPEKPPTTLNAEMPATLNAEKSAESEGKTPGPKPQKRKQPL